MKKILLLLILIYTSCNNPSSVIDLESGIIGNWWQYQSYTTVNDTFIQDLQDYTLDNTESIYSIDSTFITIYYRDYPEEWNVQGIYRYKIEGDTIRMTGDFVTFLYKASIKNDILKVTSLFLWPPPTGCYKKYTGPIPPEW